MIGTRAASSRKKRKPVNKGCASDHSPDAREGNEAELRPAVGHPHATLSGPASDSAGNGQGFLVHPFGTPLECRVHGILVKPKASGGWNVEFFEGVSEIDDEHFLVEG